MPKWLKWILSALGIGGASYGGYELYRHKHYGKDGYNAMGRDREGRDREGFDTYGYNKEGRDKYGFDIFGRDMEGRDKYGFNKEGRDRDGYDRDGYNLSGYNRERKDRIGKTRKNYMELVKSIDALIIKGKKEMDAHEYRYAISDFRPALENGVKALLEHRAGKMYLENQNGDLNNNINRCRNKGIIDEEFANKLHQMRIHFKEIHELAIEKDYNQMFFCYKTLQELKELLIKETIESD